MTLFKNKGWDVIIADDLIGGVLVLVSIVVGGLTGGIAVFIESQNDWFDNFEEVATWIAFIIGAVIGLVVCFILMGTVSSSVNSVIVLFAEAPSEFQENHPELSNKMRAAYLAAHPGIL
uniref:Choline transporter-like protein n=1 Tax=Proboscia inermis TaxID=420281 RepID=A0A7S0CL65_9STRA|mmetsp:Transcript_51211/g.51621  ORF Transcript_51211/g.51621 Transcript_51211/m.51621 type:complete len:119 (+) Transcript_51211:1111-1467(+)